MSYIFFMSPFWKNVCDELYYQGMNIKTLSQLTGIPYTTITNAKNREDNIPPADAALKIATVLGKSLESLLGECARLPESAVGTERRERWLYRKYEPLILLLEKQSPQTQEAFTALAKSLRSETA